MSRQSIRCAPCGSWGWPEAKPIICFVIDLDVRDAIDAGSYETEFVQISRLRLADKVPIAILTNYLPARFAVPEDDLRSRGLYACLTALGVHLKLAHQQARPG